MSDDWDRWGDGYLQGAWVRHGVNGLPISNKLKDLLKQKLNYFLNYLKAVLMALVLSIKLRLLAMIISIFHRALNITLLT